MIDSSGDLFGTTSQGGPTGVGTAFEIVHGTTAITALASFNNVNGAKPQAGLLLDGSGNLYGTASLGGAVNKGTIFEIVNGATAITTIASFITVNGSMVHSPLALDSSGNLFGTVFGWDKQCWHCV